MTSFVAGTFAWMAAELLLSGVMLLLYLALRRTTIAASDRYTFLKIAFLLVVFLPWMPLPWTALLASGVTNAPSSAIAATAIRIRPVVASTSIYTWAAIAVVAAYLAAVILFLAKLLVSLTRLHRLAAASTFAFAHQNIPVYATDECLPPATFGLIKPLILISRTVLKQVSAPELQMILQHEAHHIKRRDYLFNLAKASVQSILVFSPFIHKLARAFVEEMELSCDALVVSRGGHDARDYGGLLLRLTAETRPRMDLVYSGLFASNSFVSRRIAAMKNVHVKSRKMVWLTALGLFAMVAGPTIASLGLGSAVARVVAPTGDVTTFSYRASLVRANDKQESTSGAMKLVDGEQTEIHLGSLQVQITSHKVSEGWKFAIETRDPRTNRIVQSSTVVTTATEGARIDSKSADATGDDVKAFSLSLFPLVAKTPSKGGKVVGLIQSGDMVTLNFKEPTDIRDVIKTMAQVSGKNIILSRDIDSKVTVMSDHPIPKKDAYQAFVAALEQVDIIAIDEGKAIRLVRKPTAEH